MRRARPNLCHPLPSLDDCAVYACNVQAITKLEKWDMERTVTYMLTSRMFLAKILNAFIQAISYLLLANPYLLAGDQ